MITAQEAPVIVEHLGHVESSAAVMSAEQREHGAQLGPLDAAAAFVSLSHHCYTLPERPTERAKIISARPMD